MIKFREADVTPSGFLYGGWVKIRKPRMSLWSEGTLQSIEAINVEDMSKVQGRQLKEKTLAIVSPLMQYVAYFKIQGGITIFHSTPRIPVVLHFWIRICSKESVWPL